MSDFDSNLRDRFSALRRDDEASAPSFVAPARSPRRAGAFAARLAVAALVLLALFGAALRLLESSNESNAANEAVQAAPSMAGWAAPTDFLLQTPGKEILSEIPSIPGPTPESFQRLESRSKGHSS